MAPPLQHGEQQGQPAAEDTLRHPPRDRGRRRPDKALDLDDKGPPSLDDGYGDAAGHTAAAIAQQEGARIDQPAETGLGHLEQPKLAGGTVAVLRSRQQAQGLVTIAVERQHRVDEVLESARARRAHRPWSRGPPTTSQPPTTSRSAQGGRRTRAPGSVSPPGTRTPDRRPLGSSRRPGPGLELSGGADDGVEVSRSQQVTALDRGFEPFGAAPDLFARFLRRDEKRGPPLGREAREHLQDER